MPPFARPATTAAAVSVAVLTLLTDATLFAQRLVRLFVATFRLALPGVAARAFIFLFVVCCFACVSSFERVLNALLWIAFRTGDCCRSPLGALLPPA